MEELNVIDILLAMDKGELTKDEKVVKIESLSKKAKADVKFKIQELSIEEFKRISDLATTKKRHGKVDFDEIKYGIDVILKGVIEPQLRDEKLLNHYNAETPKELVKKLLKAGEIAEVCQAIEELSGYRQEVEEVVKEVEEIKN